MEDLLEHFDKQFHEYLQCNQALSDAGVTSSGPGIADDKNECFTSKRIRMLAADRDYWKAKANGNA